MVQFTIDDNLKAKLLAMARSADQSVQLCDQSGRIIRQVLLSIDRGDDTPATEATVWDLFPELTDEEIDRQADADGPWLSTEQLKAALREQS